jgi:hypothetical protein
MDTDTSSNNVVPLIDDELDQRVLELRLDGHSLHRIARGLGLSARRVEQSLSRTLPELTPELRTRLFQEDILRLDQLMVGWFQRARSGDAVATGLCIKLMERRSCMIGADASVKIELIREPQEQEGGSTVALLEQLRAIAAEGKCRDQDAQPDVAQDASTGHRPDTTPT